MKTILAFLIGFLFTGTAAFAQENLQDVNYDDNGRFAVQVEAWRSDVKADNRVSYWKEQGLDHASFAKDGDEEEGNVWFRVFLGRFASIEDARQFQDVFSGMYDNETWITTTSRGEVMTTLDGK
ncbi:MAG: SPOR domain-containing protein [Balneolaceae bacterium]|jgi:uncharacterized protein YxeA